MSMETPGCSEASWEVYLNLSNAELPLHSNNIPTAQHKPIRPHSSTTARHVMEDIAM